MGALNTLWTGSAGLEHLLAGVTARGTSRWAAVECDVLAYLSEQHGSEQDRAAAVTEVLANARREHGAA